MKKSKEATWIKPAQAWMPTRCSNCNHKALYTVYATDLMEVSYREALSPFCPSCGKPMTNPNTDEKQ